MTNLISSESSVNIPLLSLPCRQQLILLQNESAAGKKCRWCSGKLVCQLLFALMALTTFYGVNIASGGGRGGGSRGTHHIERRKRKPTAILVPTTEPEDKGVPVKIQELYNELLDVDDFNREYDMPKHKSHRVRYFPYCYAICAANGDGRIMQKKNKCTSSWPYVHVRDNPFPAKDEYYAVSSPPCFLKVAPSNIPNAGFGVFTAVALFPGFIFGPYEGRLTESADGRTEIGRESEGEMDMAYMWAVGGPGITEDAGANGTFRSIDGINTNDSNWLRFVNTARFGEEQNMVAMIYEERVYYLVIREIPAHAELLVYYGPGYLSTLGFEFPEGLWENGIAPPLKNVTCPTCSNWEGADPHEEPTWEYEDSGEQKERTALMGTGFVLRPSSPTGPQTNEFSIAQRLELR